MKEFLKHWIKSEDDAIQIGRIILSGILGCVISFLPQLITDFGLTANEQIMIVAIVMAVLKPIRDYINKQITDEGGEIPDEEELLSAKDEDGE